ESLCPDNTWLWQKTIITDGEKLYLSVQNAALTDANNTIYRQIYSLNPDGSDLTLLHTYDTSGAVSPVIRYSDGYLYFEQGFYREKIKSDAPAGKDDQYQKIMRIPVNGGKAEVVIEDEMDMNTTFYVDELNYYLMKTDKSGIPHLTIIDKENMTVTEDAAADTEGILFSIQIYHGKTYLLTSTPQTFSDTKEDGSQVYKSLNSYILYLYENNIFRQIGKGNFTFAQDGIWYTESGCDYIGTKSIPTGSHGEMTDSDIFAVTTKKVFRMDFTDYSITEYALGNDFGYGDEIGIISGAEGKLYTNISNQNQFFETGDSDYRSCLLETKNGMISIEKIYE
ncbi:MAG: hypothetical protein ACI4XJ_10805, partial [Eubacteriales bacterium]